MSLIKIHNRFLEAIAWTDASACDFTIAGSADVWRVRISSNLLRLDDFFKLINPDEADRANRYFRAKDRNRFIISRGALRIILGKYLEQHPSVIEFEKNANKKPYIKNNNKGLFYNLSHSGDWIILAVSNLEIGVDTEFVDPAFDYKEILTDNFSADEISFINQDASARNFYTLWTRKEALSKATAKGLDDDLKLIPCLDGTHEAPGYIISTANDWLVDTFILDDNYIATVAAHSKITNTRFWDIDFTGII
jgi:4'-phosphopantetheinyl transferase